MVVTLHEASIAARERKTPELKTLAGRHRMPRQRLAETHTRIVVLSVSFLFLW